MRALVAMHPGGDVGNDGVGFVGEGDYGTPPAGVDAEVADGEEAKHRDYGDECDGAEPAETLFHGFAAFHALFADIRGEGGPAVRCRIDGCAFFVGGFQKTVSPVARIEAEGADITANDAFAEDPARELLEAILLQRNQMALADFGDGSDLLERDTARNPLRPKLFPKSTHLVTSPDIIARGISTGKLLRALHV
jgi:hypothetical protein